jgi:hexokinase
MDRSLRQRISKVEKLVSKAEEFVSIALRKHEESRAQLFAALEPVMRSSARFHATAVAAIVISGEPKIDEPLLQAWARTLRHHGITIQNENEYGHEYEYEPGIEHDYAEDEYETK